MLIVGRNIKHRTSIHLSLLHTSTASPTQQPAATRRNPNTAYYDDLINEAGQSRHFPRLRHLLIERINHRCFNSSDTFNFIGKTQSSIDILDELFECLATLPKGAPRRSACNSLVERLCKLDLVNHALQVLDKMHQRNLELNATSFHPVVQKLAKGKKIEKALSVVERMREMGIAPDVTLYNYVLTTYCVKGDIARAVEWLQKMMGEEGVKGDARTYDAMVLGACRAEMVEGAMAVLRAAVDDGVTLIHSTYAHVIKALLKGRHHVQAVKFVLCFAGKEKGLDSVNFDLLATGLIKLNRFEEAKMVVNEMSHRGLAMDSKVRAFRQLNEVRQERF